MSIILLTLITSPSMAEQIEIRSEIATGDMVYDYTNTPFLWMDIDKNLSSEVITINTTGRLINKGDLQYVCTPKLQTYKNPALTGTYEIIGFLGSKYVIFDQPNEFVKLLEKWGSSDKRTLAVGDSYLMPEDFEIRIQEIDLNGDKVYVQLLKNGDEIDSEIIINGATYNYKVDDVLIFSVCVDSVFRGTESNFCQITYLWLISQDVMKVKSGDTYGELEICGTNPITLENDGAITLGTDDKIDLTDDLIIRVADNSALLYYMAKIIEMPICPESETIYITEYINVTEPCPDVVPEIITITEYVNVTATEPVPEAPGFEGFLALVGLAGISYLIIKQKD